MKMILTKAAAPGRILIMETVVFAILISLFAGSDKSGNESTVLDLLSRTIPVVFDQNRFSDLQPMERVDLEEFLNLIRVGKLSRHHARWYIELEEDINE